MIPTIISSTIAVFLFISLASVNRARRREIQALQAKLDKKTAELESAKSVGDRLLAAHEELTTEGLTPEKVAEAIQKQPTLVTTEMVIQTFKGTQDLKDAVHNALREDASLFDDVIDVDKLLDDNHVTHDWKNIGMRQIKVPKDKGKGHFHFVLMTDMCRRCRMEHQYFRDGGHPSIDEREGFFIGGKRIVTDKTPTCASIAVTDLSKALDATG